MAKRKCKFKVGDVIVNKNTGEVCEITRLNPDNDEVWMETLIEGNDESFDVGYVGHEYYKNANSNYKLHVKRLVINDVNEFLK